MDRLPSFSASGEVERHSRVLVVQNVGVPTGKIKLANSVSYAHMETKHTLAGPAPG